MLDKTHKIPCNDRDIVWFFFFWGGGGRGTIDVACCAYIHQLIKEFTILNVYILASASAPVIETMEALTVALKL